MSKWKLLAAVFLLSLALDQVTKFLAVDRLTHAFEAVGATTLPAKLSAFIRLEHLERYAEAPHVIFRPWWRMTYVENPFAAFGLFRSVPERFRYPLFIGVTIAAVVFVLAAYRKLAERQRWDQVALALVLAGALGNFCDRLLHGYVIDFVDWYWWNRPDLRWPTFNVADSSLVVGVAMLLLNPSARREKREREQARTLLQR